MSKVEMHSFDAGLEGVSTLILGSCVVPASKFEKCMYTFESGSPESPNIAQAILSISPYERVILGPESAAYANTRGLVARLLRYHSPTEQVSSKDLPTLEDLELLQKVSVPSDYADVVCADLRETSTYNPQALIEMFVRYGLIRRREAKGGYPVLSKPQLKEIGSLGLALRGESFYATYPIQNIDHATIGVKEKMVSVIFTGRNFQQYTDHYLLPDIKEWDLFCDHLQSN